jgi:hypothetical protein
VAALCKRLVRIGFISGLDVSFTPPNRPIPPGSAKEEMGLGGVGTDHFQ